MNKGKRLSPILQRGKGDLLGEGKNYPFIHLIQKRKEKTMDIEL